MRTILLTILLLLTPCAALADITTNLLAWYKFEEGTGTTAADSSGNGKDGTLAGGAAWTNGRIDRGVSLDGTDDYIQLPTTLGIDNVGAVTIAAWFKPASLGDFEMLFSHYVSDSQRIEMCLSGAGNGGSDDFQCILCTGATPTEAWTEQNHIETATWQHWVMVFDGSLTGNTNRLKFYRGGKRIEFLTDDDPPQSAFNGTVPALTTNSGGTASYIGSRAGSSLRLHGVVDEVRIYSRALTDSDVGELGNYRIGPIDAVFPAGGLSDYRIVKIASGEFGLCSSTDTNRIGFTDATTGARLVRLAHSRYALIYSTTDQTAMGAFRSLAGDDMLRTVTLEAAAGATITSGAVVYQSTDGTISHTGTVRVGVAIKCVQSTSPELWSVFPD